MSKSRVKRRVTREDVFSERSRADVPRNTNSKGKWRAEGRESTSDLEPSLSEEDPGYLDGYYDSQDVMGYAYNESRNTYGS
jgi:hypothetical protein